MATTKSLPPDLPQLPDRWEWKTLQELLHPQRNICYGVVQPGDHMVGGIPIVRAKGIKNGRVEEPDPLRIASEIDAKHTKSRLIGGEILITLVGEYFGEVAVAPPTLAGFNTARAVGVVPVELDAQFISFALQAPVTQHYIKTWATTTAQPTLNLCDVAQLPIPMPPKWERDKIAHILGTLDDKIKLNQQMNHTLESIARALFKSWFIDFDPVRAKMDGRQPAGMDAETAALFPDEFEDSLLGKIPKGWKMSNLSEQVELFTGHPFKSSQFVSQYEGEYKLARGDNVKEGVFQWGDKAKYWQTLTPELERYKLKKNDVLIGMDGSKVGKNWVRVQEHHLPILLVQRVACLRARAPMSPFFIRFLVGCTEFANYVELVRTGTSIPHISGKQIQILEFPFPDKAAILETFHKSVMPLFDRFDSHDEEIATLTSIRDALLPKLLSGEVRIQNAQKVVEQELSVVPG